MRSVAYAAEAAVLRRYLLRRGVRHVHAHFGTNSTAVARCVVHMDPRFTYSFTIHGPDEFDSPVALDLRGKTRDASFVVVVSNFGRAQLRRWTARSDWSRIHVIHCIVGEEWQTNEPRCLPERPTALFVGRLAPQKGVFDLIDAFGLVLERIPASRLWVIGDGPLEPEVRSIASERLGSSVVLMGWQSESEIRESLGQSTILVAPSYAEGLPVVIMEALSLGVAVVSTYVAGIPELVDTRNGWLVPSGNALLLADAIIDAFGTSQETHAAKAACGMEMVARKFTATTEAPLLFRLFAGLGAK